MPSKTRKVKAAKRTDPWGDIAVYLRLYGNLHFKPIWKYATPRRLLLPQVGGGEVTVENQTFEYNEDANLDGRLFVIRGKKTESHECFRVDIEVHPNGQVYAILSSLDGNKACSTDGSAKSANILKAAVEVARRKGAQWIELSDSSKICKDKGLPSVSLANYYFLSRAQTWYESILPFQPDDHDHIQRMRQTILANSWKTVAQRFRRDNPTLFTQMMREMPVSLDSIPVHTPGSAMQVIKSIPYEARCAFLHKYMKSLLLANKITSLDGEVWWLPLTPDANRPSYYAPMDTITIERNGYEAEGNS